AEVSAVRRRGVQGLLPGLLRPRARRCRGRPGGRVPRGDAREPAQPLLRVHPVPDGAGRDAGSPARRAPDMARAGALRFSRRATESRGSGSWRGVGPESTIDYYRRILAAWEREDPSTTPSIVIDSLDVQRALRLVANDRPALIEYLVASVRRLAGAGVDFVAMTANTPHIVFDEIVARSPVPMVSIVEVCAEEARRLE